MFELDDDTLDEVRGGGPVLPGFAEVIISVAE